MNENKPAAPAANALPELIPTDEDNAATIEWEGAAEGWPKDAVPVGWLTCRERQLAAAQQEIAELLRILKAIFSVKVTMTSDDRINWEVNVRYAGTTGEEIENSIAHAEPLGGKK